MKIQRRTIEEITIVVPYNEKQNAFDYASTNGYDVIRCGPYVNEDNLIDINNVLLHAQKSVSTWEDV